MVWTEMERWPRHKAVTCPQTEELWHLRDCRGGKVGVPVLLSLTPCWLTHRAEILFPFPPTSGARGVSPAHLCSVQVWGEETSQRGAVRKHAKGCSSSAQDTQTLPALDTQGTNSVPSPEDRQWKPPGIPSTPHISGKYSLLAQDVETIPLKRPLAFFNQLTLLPRKLQ